MIACCGLYRLRGTSEWIDFGMLRTLLALTLEYYTRIRSSADNPHIRSHGHILTFFETGQGTVIPAPWPAGHLAIIVLELFLVLLENMRWGGSVPDLTAMEQEMDHEEFGGFSPVEREY